MIPFVFAVAIVAAVIYCAMATHRWLAAQWFLVRLWRFFTGMPHHGKPITNAGWTRRGYGDAMTPTRHAHSWWYRPRWQRSSHRIGGFAGFFALVYGVLRAPVMTMAFVSAALLALTGWLAWRVRCAWAARTERRTWLHPLHLAAHELAGHPKAIPAKSWISTTLNADGSVKSAKLELPPGWSFDDGDMKRLELVAARKLGIEDAVPHWIKAGPAPLLRLVHSPPPPGHVDMEELLPEAAKCAADELVIGVGKGGEIVRASLATDSPHIAISMGTGAGKSNLAGWILLQMLLKGGIGLVLDPKDRLSYPWILKDEHRQLSPLPCVAYAWTTAQLHASMEWLTAERGGRGDIAFAGINARGKIHANVGPRLFTVAEELNLAAPQLRAYWQQHREPGDPAKSPAFTGLADLMFSGRAVFMNGVLIGQCLTAEVTGSRDSAVKEQCGVKMMARYGPKGWRIMAEDIPMPPSPSERGRVQVITTGPPKLTQVPELDGVQARELVLASDMSLLPYDMPCKPREPATVAAGLNGGGASDLGEKPVSQPSGVPAGLGTLEDALRLGGLHPSTTISSLKMARHRDPGFPRHKDVWGKAYVYDLSELAAYDEARRS